MRPTIKLMTVAAALGAAALSGLAGPVARSADQAKLPGHPGPGPYVAGCVDCHVTDGAGTMGSLLEKIGHRNVDKATAKVPADCVECHSEDGGFTPLNELAHMLHYDNPAANAFIKDYGGNCLHCHALDAKTGVITVKSGAKNW